MAAIHAAVIRRLGLYAEVRVGCLKAEPELAEALAGAPPPLVVTPLLMSDGYIFELVRRRLASLPVAGHLRLAQPVGQHPGLTGLIEHSAIQICRRQGWTKDRASLLLVAHGTPRHGGSADHARNQARRLAGAGFAAVATAFLEEPPLPEEAVAGLPAGPIVAVGLFIDNGPHGDQDVREALAPVADRIAYTGALGVDPDLVPLILAQAEQVMRAPAGGALASSRCMTA